MGAKTVIRVYKSSFSAVALLNAPENTSPALSTIDVKMAPDIARSLSTRAQWRLLVKTAMVPGQKSLVETNAVIASFGPKGEQGSPTPLAAAMDHAVLGVLLASVTPAIASALSLTNTDGAMVTTVAPASAAEKAGIKQGDILLKAAGKDIKGPFDVGAALTGVPVGSSTTITLIHQGAHADVTVSF